MGMETVYVRKIMFSNELFKTEPPWIQWSNLTPTLCDTRSSRKNNKKGQASHITNSLFSILIFVRSFAAPKPILNCL